MTKEQFGELIMTNKESLYRVAKSVLRNDDDCADAIEEAIVKGFENLRSLKKDEFAKTWLIRILLNECYSIYRFKQKSTRVVSSLLKTIRLVLLVRKRMAEAQS